MAVAGLAAVGVGVRTRINPALYLGAIAMGPLRTVLEARILNIPFKQRATLLRFAFSRV
jgi:hypothetical protein